MGDALTRDLRIRDHHKVLHLYFSHNLLWTYDLQGVQASEAPRRQLGTNKQGYFEECDEEQVQAR